MRFNPNIAIQFMVCNDGMGDNSIARQLSLLLSLSKKFGSAAVTANNSYYLPLVYLPPPVRYSLYTPIPLKNLPKKRIWISGVEIFK